MGFFFNDMIVVSIKDIQKNDQHAYAWNLLRQCLRRRGIAFSEENISKGEHGKPYLPAYPGLNFNISHADGIAACIVSERECGIDCEPVQQYRPNVMRRAFTESEISLVENAPEEEKNLLFFRLWTLKEAYIKATGEGLTFPLKEAEFGFSGGRIISDLQGYRFRQYIGKNSGYVISVCEKCE